jgi:hypothetical protein
MKTIKVLLLVSLLAAVIWGCDDQKNQLNQKEYLITKTYYAAEMCFDSDQGYSSRIQVALNSGDYTDCVFVLLESESSSYSANILVAWPTKNTERVLSNLNFVINYEEIDLESYSFEYPITMEDVVERWEDVYSLFDAFTDSQLRYIWTPENADF